MNPTQFKWNVILIMFCMCCSFIINAQQQKRDVVYLKNGSVIKGTILEMIPNETIKIETADGSIFIYKMEEVEKTQSEIVASEPRRRGDRERIAPEGPGEDVKFTPSGYFLIMRFGPAVSPSIDSDGINFSVGMINGLQVNDYLSLGIGGEVTNYTFNEATVNVYPVFLDTRIYVPRRRVHPMFSFGFGYSFVGKKYQTNDINSSYSNFTPNSGKGGLYMSFGAGMRIFITNKISFVADGGFTFQNLKGSSSSSYYYPDEAISKNIPSLKVNVGVAMSFGKPKKAL